MSIRYDDALPALVQIVNAAGVDLTAQDTLVLRDAQGRLGIAFEKRRHLPGLANKLRERLGAYALPEPVLPSALFPSIQAASPREVFVWVGERLEPVRLVERRIVGADWLSDLAPPPPGPPRLVFGSLKGGVGRTTALAVLAMDLAQAGKRVLCMDLDLEAPGLSTTLLSNQASDDRRPRYGALDYLVEDGLNPIQDDELSDFVGISHFAQGEIRVLPAVGRETDAHPENMIAKLSRGLIEDVGQEGRLSVATQLRRMVDRFVAYFESDVVLIDARAGLAELTAGTWLSLGARKLLLFGVDQPQTFMGYRYVLSHLVSSLGVPQPTSEEDWRTRLTFVHSKAPTAGKRRLLFREKLYELCLETLYEQEEDKEKLEPVFSFGLHESGLDIPHDATHITFHPDYDAFSPLDDGTVLQAEVYGGPFGAFLTRSWRLLGWERSS
ncbi:MAG: KGGVGR-motif variant AAA ATPase [Myxococcota bacterium]